MKKKIKPFKKLCSFCYKNLTAEKGTRVQYLDGRVVELHKSCAKKLLKETADWKLY